MKIATWNLESAHRLTPSRKTAFLDAMRKVDADVWVLTETWVDFSLKPDHRLVAQSRWADDLRPDQCWVAIWARESLQTKPLDIESQPDRMACGRIEQPGQSDLVVVGTVLPWPNDKQWPGATGFCEALDLQAGEWKQLRGTPETCTLVVAGDFNQSLPNKRYFGSAKGATALSDALARLDLDCLTLGDDPLTGEPRIDHICLSRSGLQSPVVPRTGAWEVPCLREKPITDHAGVSADLPYVMV
jgi:endonuclease/exonuclease/phosphatase family metal-dependent hydrolase